MLPPISYYGGKQNMVRHILPLIPKHHIYAEPFAGGAAVFWHKAPVKIELLNDINKELINFYEVVKSNCPNFLTMVNTTAHSRAWHHYARFIYHHPDLFCKTRRAWAIFIMANQSFISKLDATWGYDKTQGKCNRTFYNKKKRLDEQLVQRLENAQLECTCALKLIDQLDSENTFFYLDPPYPNTNQGHYGGYSMNDFEMLLNKLSNIKGKFLLSSYPYNELNEKLKEFDWHQKSFDQQLSAARKKGSKKIEVLTANYKLA